ncbi:MAG TPA: hypothetical protein EYP25_02600, partial [Anaerolineae bacterium]|nr:hypothetical protein [Anaerolineae bacterium]
MEASVDEGGENGRGQKEEGEKGHGQAQTQVGAGRQIGAQRQRGQQEDRAAERLDAHLQAHAGRHRPLAHARLTAQREPSHQVPHPAGKIAGDLRPE